ncbi:MULTISPECIES: hypothetical protein [Streptomyces]|nr:MULTISPECIES: hypothetical protein [Streptomyces]MYS98816.1 hypothetical protein [Streptomyces sp. SID5469]
MVFNQSGWNVGKVYNIAGDLRLTDRSSPQEFAEALNELRSRIRALEDVPGADLAAMDAELAQAALAADTHAGEHATDAATDDAASGEDATGDGPSPGDDIVAGRLTRVANRLRALGTATAAASELGTSLDTMAQWVGHHL